MDNAMQMNKTNITRLIGLIRALDDHEFNMGKLLKTEFAYGNCGTPSCMAGWAAWLEQGKPKKLYDNQRSWDSGENSLVESALDFMGIPEKDRPVVRNELFRGAYSGSESTGFTKAQTIETLREFMASGRIEWPAVPSEDEAD